MAKFVEEFKEFALKGNVMDMAVGVIIGGAFGKIVTSFVSDILMPPLGVLLGGVDFTDLKVVLKDAVPAQIDAAGNEIAAAIEPVTWNYGAFIQNIVDFLIIALCIFFMIKGIAKLTSLKKKKEAEEAAAEPPAPSNEEVLLTEIRDLLKDKK
ncbi:MAG: large-conductance mechanosensitive channel protein MscL [Bacteroidaceae bacterium]|nr:large-conductance mechanosensitive channel protein MscL [Bacteroidaceae bacterium]MCR4837254.1 large-conductance mechanosensitive channel protein MscL [Bacteroidaceae bacterium]